MNNMIVRDKQQLDVFTKAQSIADFRKNAEDLKTKIGSSQEDRMLGHQKQGIAKELLDEIIPLAAFAEMRYTNGEKIAYSFGNQGHDASVFNQDGEKIHDIEITLPQLGYENARRNDNLVKQIDAYGIGMVDDSKRLDPSNLYQVFEEVAKNKANKEYSNCILVFVLELFSFCPPLPGETEAVEKIQEIVKMQKYNAINVYLFEFQGNSKCPNKIVKIQ